MNLWVKRCIMCTICRISHLSMKLCFLHFVELTNSLKMSPLKVVCFGNKTSENQVQKTHTRKAIKVLEKAQKIINMNLQVRNRTKDTNYAITCLIYNILDQKGLGLYQTDWFCSIKYMCEIHTSNLPMLNPLFVLKQDRTRLWYNPKKRKNKRTTLI